MSGHYISKRVLLELAMLLPDKTCNEMHRHILLSIDWKLQTSNGLNARVLPD